MLFTGINNLGRTVILMGCFLTRENIEGYRFALNSFEALGFKKPNCIMTDDDKALKSAIASEWPSSRHLLCYFHLFRNLQKNIAKILGTNNHKFLSEFSQISKLVDEKDFEIEWRGLVVSKYVKQEDDLENQFDEIRENNNDSDDEEETMLKKIITNFRSRNQRLEKYLSYLYENKRSWARCFTYKVFSAGLS